MTRAATQLLVVCSDYNNYLCGTISFLKFPISFSVFRAIENSYFWYRRYVSFIIIIQGAVNFWMPRTLANNGWVGLLLL